MAYKANVVDKVIFSSLTQRLQLMESEQKLSQSNIRLSDILGTLLFREGVFD